MGISGADLLVAATLAAVVVVPRAIAEQWPGATWRSVTPAQAGMDAARLGGSKPSGDVALFRGGYLVYESGSTTTPRPQYSASKAFTSMICARLKQMGRLDFGDQVPNSNNAPTAAADWGIDDFKCGVPYPDRPLATFRHFMNMQSDFGLDGYAPGKHGAYNNNAVHFYGTHMNRTYFGNVSPVDFLKRAILDHTGFENSPGYGGQYGGWDGGWRLSLRDAGRLGLLMLRRGKWDGQQLIPESYVNECFRSQNGGVPLNNSKPCGNDKWNQGFGLGSYAHAWWVADGDATYASGYQGHFVCIIRDADIVVTTHGGSSGRDFIAWARKAVTGPFSDPGNSPGPGPDPTPAVAISLPAAGTELTAGREYSLEGAGERLTWYYDANSDGKGRIEIGTGPSVNFTVPLDIGEPRTLTLFLEGTGGSDSRQYLVIDRPTSAVPRPCARSVMDFSEALYGLDGKRVRPIPPSAVGPTAATPAGVRVSAQSRRLLITSR